ncbi:MAG: hypothetical protein UW45_C0052G0004 [Parcubacteria group bacterium GW2011_GWC2_44_22]|nr:MAG: hypothetical protein UW45_C0052G0004 [Parcubacteria group bacterium GW2011_GWC2_44_22]
MWRAKWRFVRFVIPSLSRDPLNHYIAILVVMILTIALTLIIHLKRFWVVELYGITVLDIPRFWGLRWRIF